MTIKDVYTTIPEAGFDAPRRQPSPTAISRFFEAIRGAYDAAGLTAAQYMADQKRPGIIDEDEGIFQVLMLERSKYGTELGSVCAASVSGHTKAEMQIATQNGNFTGTNGIYLFGTATERNFQLTKGNLNNLTGFIMERSDLFVPTDPQPLLLPNRHV